MPLKLNFKFNPALTPQKIANLRRAVGWQGREDKLRQVLSSNHFSVACFAEEQLVGYVEVLSDGVEDALIRNLIVCPSYQRKGIALKLLKMTTERLKAEKIKTINVLFEPQHEELYFKAGFRVVGGGLMDNEKEGL